MITPDFIALIKLFPSSEGGRAEATPENFFGCPLSFGGSLHDCRMLLDEIGPIAPGEEKKVPIKMLNIDSVRELLRKGAEFNVWDGRIVGKGKIVKINKVG